MAPIADAAVTVTINATTTTSTGRRWWCSLGRRRSTHRVVVLSCFLSTVVRWNLFDSSSSTRRIILLRRLLLLLWDDVSSSRIRFGRRSSLLLGFDVGVFDAMLLQTRVPPIGRGGGGNDRGRDRTRQHHPVVYGFVRHEHRTSTTLKRTPMINRIQQHATE